MKSETIACVYSPAVGDRFRKPAGTAKNNRREDIPTPERCAEVTMLNHAHVVCLIDGKEYTMAHGDFIHLAEKTLAGGATLTRAA